MLPMSSAGGFSEHWEIAGFPGWSITGGDAVARDCVIGQTGCSMKMGFSGERHPRAQKGVGGDATGASFWVRGSGLGANRDFSFNLQYDGWLSAQLTFTEDTQPNVWSLRTPAGSEIGFFTALPDTWYRVSLTMENGHARVWVHTTGGTLVDSTGLVPFHPNPGTITSVEFAADRWNLDPTETLEYRFDTLVVGGGGFSLASEPGPNVGEVRLTWTSTVGGATSYNILRGTDRSGDLSVVATVPATQETYTDTQLANGTEYHYRVAAMAGTTELARTWFSSSTPRPDTVTTPSALAATPAGVWTGDPTTVSFSYTVTASQCPTGSPCDVENEWRIYLDGTTGRADGTLLGSGRKAHDGHAGATTFSVSTIVNPTGTNGAHKIKAAVQTRVGSTAWRVAEIPIWIDTPLPGWMSGPTPLSASPTTRWPGETIQLGSSYTVYQKQCKTVLLCPITNDWKLSFGGSPGQADGTIIFSGANSHPAHGETQNYAISRTWTVPLIAAGSYPVKIAARIDSSSAYVVNGQTINVRGTEASTTPPTNFMVHPEFMFSGQAAASFDYTVTSMSCAAPLVCDTTSSWQIRTDGAQQNGDYSSAAFDGIVSSGGTDMHPSHGSAESYHVAQTVSFDSLVPGEHWIKAGVRALDDDAQTWRVKSARVVVLSVDDPDGDGVPESLETELCNTELQRILIESTPSNAAGSCEGDSVNGWNYAPPFNSTTLNIPTKARKGPDNDNDGFPSYIDVFYTGVFINRTDPGSTSVDDAGWSRQTIDEFDGDANRPVISIVCTLTTLPTEVGGEDSDNDGFPADTIITQSTVCVDKRDGMITTNPGAYSTIRQTDPDDGNPNSPVQSYFNQTNIPVNVTFGKDNDRDGIPSYRNTTYVNLSYDRRNHAVPTLTYWTEVTKLDVNDGDRNSPVLWAAIDSDGDFIPDGAEFPLCLAQRDSDPLDGECPAGNFIPPSWFQSVLDRVFQ